MTGDNDARLAELTRVRSVAALPVAGRYRLIDFTLSGMVNSGISNVGVTTRSNYRSLMDHLGSGKEWDLNRKLYGLRILPPYIQGGEQYRGDMDVLHGIKTFWSIQNKNMCSSPTAISFITPALKPCSRLTLIPAQI